MEEEMGYYIANMEDADAADFPNIESWVWEELRKIWDDIDMPCTDYETAEVKLALLRGDHKK